MISTLTVITSQVINMPSLAFTQQDYQNNLKQQDQLKAQINQTQGEEKTLSSQISQMDNQISLNERELSDTQGQIQSTQALLTQVNSNIDQVSLRLGNLNDSIGQIQAVADARIRDSYKKSRMPSMAAIVAATDFKEAMHNLAYVKTMQAQDNALLAQINDNRKNYSEQKDSLTQLKTQKEQLNSTLQNKEDAAKTQQKELETQKDGRATLLTQTKGQESLYQKLLSDAKAEANAMASAIVNSGVQSRHVNRGDVIAFEGDTGCATGAHLHFSYRLTPMSSIGATISSGHWINPAPYLDSGKIGKPISGYPAKISQSFGQTAIAGLYGPDGHPGIDIADAYGTPIMAAQSGMAVRWSDSGCVLNGVQTDRGEGIIITGDDGTQTLYWHIQR
jgi:peptidoglycan hydrolase CwlO-like protein